jgi:hypothetical protein
MQRECDLLPRPSGGTQSTDAEADPSQMEVPRGRRIQDYEQSPGGYGYEHSMYPSSI